MATVNNYETMLNTFSAVREQMVRTLSSQLTADPQLAEDIISQIDQQFAAAVLQDRQVPPPPDNGLAQLVGIGPTAAGDIGDTVIPQGVQGYDNTVTPERFYGMADLFYIYQHERLGVFKAVLKLQELFKAGTVRLSGGDGAFRLYHYDRKQVLRYTMTERLQAYNKAFGYTQAGPPNGSFTNRDFHRLLVGFCTQVAQFFRDKRISDVIRPQSDRASFGSIAVVRRSALDLRDNLKHASYGHISVLRIEVMQLLDEAFRILNSDDVRRLFGADNAWDVIEEVFQRYLNQPHMHISARSRMAVAGREILRWLAQSYALNQSRPEFEALLLQIVDESEEFLTSAESLGIVRPRLTLPLPVESRGSRLAQPLQVMQESNWEVG